MALLAANDHAVVEGVVSMPLVGVWHADVLVDVPSALSGQVTLATYDGALSLTGTAQPGRTDEWIASAIARVVAGAGGLARTAAAKFYRSATLRIVLADLLQTAGETLSSSADSGILGTQLPTWTTPARPIGQVIGVLFEQAAPTASWRMLPDGTFWCGPEAWTAVPSGYEYQVLERFPNEGRMKIATTSLLLVPGMSLPTGEKLGYVEHRVAAGSVRSELWWS